MNRILPIPLLGYWPKSLFPTNHMKSEFEHTLQRSTTFYCVNMLSKIDRSNAKTFFQFYSQHDVDLECQDTVASTFASTLFGPHTTSMLFNPNTLSHYFKWSASTNISCSLQCTNIHSSIHYLHSA